jgi:uncharacterized membrane protein
LYHVFVLVESWRLVKSAEWVYNAIRPLVRPTAAPGKELERYPTLEANVANPERIVPRWPKLTVVLVALSVLVIVSFVVVSPSSLLGKADAVGYAVCHRIPERSFTIAGRQLPLCARCTGTFLGAVLGLTVMPVLRRQRASLLPPVSVLLMLVLFVGLWGFDGLNSYMTLFPGGPHLYEPQNWLRMTTGMLNGLALFFFVFPIYSFTLWRQPTSERVLGNIWELLAILPVVALLVFVTWAEVPFLLYPLAIVSSLGVLMMLAIVNSMLVTVVLGREGYAETWRQVLVPLAVGVGLAILQIAALVWVRDYLTAKLGLPF